MVSDVCQQKGIGKMFQNGQTETKLYIDTTMSKFVRSKKAQILKKMNIMSFFDKILIFYLIRLNSVHIIFLPFCVLGFFYIP